MTRTQPSEPNELRQRIAETAATASRGGALTRIDTDTQVIREAGIDFSVRVATSPIKKPIRQERVAAPTNPFLPYDRQLFVGEVSDEYVCLLNKYPVVDHHLLLVTREFEEQSSPLGKKDLAALAHCLIPLGGIAFYNSGPVAGASQRHRHLQWVPLAADQELPVGWCIEQSSAKTKPAASRVAPALPFSHYLAEFTKGRASADSDADVLADHLFADQVLAAYQRMLFLCRSDHPDATAYNLLVTRSWMMLIPRYRECFQAISLNAMAFAGCFFVRSAEDLSQLHRHGPLAALQHVTSG